MGLDIHACSKISFAPNQDPDDDEADDENLLFIEVARDFAAQADGLRNGFYLIGGDSYEFRAGGYGGYNTWRDHLAKLAGYPATMHARKAGSEPEPRHDVTVWKGARGPFCELINFSDSGGAIGPSTSAKLAADFAAFLAAAQALNDEDFLTLYSDFQRAFILASDGGAVVFC